jgi:serralysin
MSSAPTAAETYFLELINRARAQPQAEASRLGIGLNDSLAAGTISTAAKQPLAFSTFLNSAADRHTASMLAGNYFDHTGSDGSSASQRVFAAGWTSADGGWRIGENISWRGSTASSVGTNAPTVDFHHDGLFKSAGHRTNLMQDAFSEIGISQGMGSFTSGGTNFTFTSMVTQNFAHGGRTFITGVVLNDGDGDRFYDIGEGLGAVTVKATGAGRTYTTTSWDSGAYALEVADGTYTVSFTGGNLGGTITKTITVAGRNVKVDGFSQEAASAGGATAGNDTFRATAGNDAFDGLAGLDTVVIAATRATATIAKAGAVLTVTGAGLGTDTFTNIERLSFSNGTLAFDLDGNAGQTYRLYQAAFARTPDTAGLGHNTRIIDGGMTLKDMSAAFIGSAEFIARYGQNTSNTTFITALYQNVLGRGPDSAGLAGWQQRLADGSWSRPDVLLGFSESAENKALVGAAIENGIWLG